MISVFNRWIKKLLVNQGKIRLMLVGCLVLGLGLGLGHYLAKTAQAQIMTSPDLALLGQHLPLYPQSTFYPLGNFLQVEGKVRQMAFAISHDRPEKIASYYESVWRTQGFQVRRTQNQEETMVSAYAGTEVWLRTMLAVLNPVDQTTTIFLSLSPSLDLKSEPKLPIPKNCSWQSHLGALDYGINTDGVILSCLGYASEVISFYNHFMSSTPHLIVAGSEADHQKVWQYQSPAGQLTLMLSQYFEPKPKTAVILFWQRN